MCVDVRKTCGQKSVAVAKAIDPRCFFLYRCGVRIVLLRIVSKFLVIHFVWSSSFAPQTSRLKSYCLIEATCILIFKLPLIDTTFSSQRDTGMLEKDNEKLAKRQRFTWDDLKSEIERQEAASLGDVSSKSKEAREASGKDGKLPRS